MQWFKRIAFFFALNIVVMLTVSTIVSLLGLDTRYLTSNGLNIASLATFCLVWGMVGSFISLAISRWMAKKMMGVQLVDNNTYDARLVELKQTVHELAKGAGLKVMPEVGYYESPDLNAFATGPTKNRSLVAVSSGLLRGMNRDQLRGVLAHEVAHIANGDMVTMTLLQGVVNAFVMFFARLAAYGVTQLMRSDDDESPVGGLAFHLITMLFEVVFMIGGWVIIASFSRWREYRADAGGARLGGREKMIAALQALKNNANIQAYEHQGEAQVAAFKIEGGKSAGLARFFSTHPDLDSRIARLQQLKIS